MASGTGFGGVTVDAAFRIQGAAENVSAVIDLKPWFVAKSTQKQAPNPGSHKPEIQNPIDATTNTDPTRQAPNTPPKP